MKLTQWFSHFAKFPIKMIEEFRQAAEKTVPYVVSCLSDQAKAKTMDYFGEYQAARELAERYL